jgi:heat shock protein HslJ
MNRRASLLLLVAVSVGLIACNSVAPGASPSPSPAPSNPPTAGPPSATPPANTAPAGVDGRQFLSVSVKDGDADHPLVPGSRISLDFNAGNLGARAGCNHLFGSYTVDGDVLIVTSMGQTEMGCEPALMAQDQWLIAFLGSRPTIALSGNDLVLTSGDTVISLLDREIAEPDQPLAGITWTLTSIVTGDTVSSLPVGISATFLFHEDGTVELFDGCNSGGGTYAVEGDQIRFIDIVLTEMACAGAAGQVEQAVIALLNSDSVTWTIDASTLTLMAGQDGLIFSAAMDLPIREL